MLRVGCDLPALRSVYWLLFARCWVLFYGRRLAESHHVQRSELRRSVERVGRMQRDVRRRDTVAGILHHNGSRVWRYGVRGH